MLVVFDVERNGSVSNVRVIESYPQEVFDSYAIAAAEQWVYEPVVIEGRTAKTSDVKNIIKCCAEYFDRTCKILG